MQNIQLPNVDGKQEFLTSSDLVDLGLFPSVNAVYSARKRGVSPDFVKVGAKVLYPKSCVVDFVKSCFKKGKSQVDANDNLTDDHDA